MLTFTFKLSTRVRHGLVDRQAGRTLTQHQTRNIQLKQPIKDLSTAMGLSNCRTSVRTVLRRNYAGTSVTHGCRIRHSAINEFVGGRVSSL